MSIPSFEEFQDSHAEWSGAHMGIRYLLSWHGRSDYQRQGIWCWYLLLNQEQFYPDDWQRLRLEKQDREFAGSMHRHWDYDAFPDLEAHGGWTYGKMETYLGRDGREYEQVKVGCDYNHLWDHEGGYPHTKSAVEADVRLAIERLCREFPNRRQQCAYCGWYGEPSDFYENRHGKPTCHKHIETFKQDGWDGWLPKSA